MYRMKQAPPTVWQELGNTAYWNGYHCWYGGDGAPRNVFPPIRRSDQIVVASILAMSVSAQISSGSTYTIRLDSSLHDQLPMHFNLDFSWYSGRVGGPLSKVVIQPSNHWLDYTDLWTPESIVSAFGMPTAASGTLDEWFRR